MSTTAQSIFKDLEVKRWKPFYLVVGEEPLQAAEISERLKKFFVKSSESESFNLEIWDGENLDAGGLLTSLEMLPGLFSAEGEVRLVICHRFEKATAAALELLQRYFENPVDSTCFLMLCHKVDKRKAWVKRVEEKGELIEVREPYDREWPKWHSYFEKRIGKRIEPAAWEMCVATSNRTLSLLAMELEKLSVYIGANSSIRLDDVRAMVSNTGTEDVFSLAEDVLMKRKAATLRKYDALLRQGESDIKILSILVRQFRMVEGALGLSKAGVTDSKIIASKIGAHPFFVSKVIEQTRVHTRQSLGHALDLLAETDFQLKTGVGTLFDSFLVPYLGAETKRR